MSETKCGTVKWFSAKKGYGFVTGEDGEDYFAHFSQIKMEGFKRLSGKQPVQFEVGRALKFYSSIRLDVRRVETLKQGGEMVGNHTRIKVVKNKVAPPFKQAEFDIMFGTGISKEGDILDLAAENSIVNKSGAWYAYEGNKIGQGRENAKLFLKEHPDICDEIERKVRIHYHLLPGEEEEQQDVKQEETTPESDAPAAEEE